jgi:hypothetical protein
MTFTGDFDFLPVRAILERGAVPSHPTMVDFDNAQTFGINADPFTVEGAADVWWSEAVRWRRGSPGDALDIPAIAAKTAARLFKMQAAVLDR